MFICELRRVSRLTANRLRCYAVGCFSLLGVLLSSLPCQAHNTYPEQLAEQLNMPCVPQCTICHRDNSGGFNSVVEPFGIAMQKAGLTFFPPTLEPAVKQLEADAADSDGDGTPDILELSAGQDPNGNVDLCAVQSPRYGCGARIAPAPAPDYSSGIGAWFVAAVLAASAQRRHRQRQGLYRRHRSADTPESRPHS